MLEDENLNEAEKPQLNIGAVSGSFSMDEVKNLLWYGETRDLKVTLKDNPRKKGEIGDHNGPYKLTIKRKSRVFNFKLQPIQQTTTRFGHKIWWQFPAQRE